MHNNERIINFEQTKQMQPKVNNIEQLKIIVDTILAVEDLKDKSERVNDDARMHFTMKDVSDSMIELTIWNVDYLEESPFENDTHEPKFAHMTFNIPTGTPIKKVVKDIQNEIERIYNHQIELKKNTINKIWEQ